LCGICGVVSVDPAETIDAFVLRAMRDTLAHRGPDDCGSYIGRGVALGHRRLSVIDLRPEGRQPMSNEDGRVHIVFNGEIYNFEEHRSWLAARGHRFRSRTDTEVIIHLYEELGIDCLRRLRGMFAFALWDERERLLFLARDRVGKKPLYYRWDGKRLVFGSEPKAILAHPQSVVEPDPIAIDCYVALGYVPSPMTAFKGVCKLPAAHYLTLRDGQVEVKRYWELKYSPKLEISEDEACEEIVRKLTECVRLRMISDVPLGAFLSGGVDSSAIVSLMSRLSSRPVRTFSIGFQEPAYDESAYAKAVAENFGAEHLSFCVTPESIDVLEKLVWHYNEPYADAACVPTYYLCRMAREYVTVALNGDGGDENFAGYDRYTIHQRLAYLDRLPAGLLKIAAGAARRAADAMPESLAGGRLAAVGEVLASGRRLNYARTLTRFRRARRRAMYSDGFAALVEAPNPENLILALYNQAGEESIDAALYLDVNLYLSDCLLPKVDIAAMAVGLETRSPLLDHEFMEFAARLPARFKLDGSVHKAIFRKAFGRILDLETAARPKKGFDVPFDRWFRGDVAGYLTDVLLSAASLGRGYFKPSAVKKLVGEHLDGVRDWHNHLFSLLMLELWHRRFVDSANPARFREAASAGC